MIENRRKIIKKIQDKRDSKVICYFLGDRPSLETKVHPEVLPLFYKLLKNVAEEKVKKIDVFLYGTGGLTNAAWGISNLLNEFANHYNVFIPFKALSALTLIALGAKEIIMTELGQLSPIDPSVNSPYNPEVPNQPKGPQRKLLPVPVEDSIAFLDLAKNEAKVEKEEELVKIFLSLSERVHPLALGNVYRSREQIKMLSDKLLAKNIPDQKIRESIINTLTKELYSHDYIISRSEAENLIGLQIKHDPEIEDLISSLYYEYEKITEIGISYNPEIEFQKAKEEDNNGILEYQRAFVEDDKQCFCYMSKRKFTEVLVQRPGVPFKEKLIKSQELFQGWRELDE